MPHVLPLSLSSDYVKEGDYVQFTCVASKGDLPITFTWLLDGEEIGTAATTVNVGRQTSLLIIQSVTFRHAGEYTCIANNPAGSTNETSFLVVKGINFLHSVK